MLDKLSRLLLSAVLISVFWGATKSEARAEYPAPDFKLKDTKGDFVTLSSYQDKKAVILLFWATWCPYCRKELKNLNSMYQELKKEGFEVLAVNTGESFYKADNFAKDYKLNYPVLLDEDTSVTSSYGVAGIPFYVIIDKKGKISFTDYHFPHDQYKKLVSP
jgi:cytochrome c biogenesis protein CcmG/thiol:disulfide interchange protein DsbE